MKTVIVFDHPYTLSAGFNQPPTTVVTAPLSLKNAFKSFNNEMKRST
ncbi:hypothetical protein [Lentilactobacillus senioris]|nr:hypothetical protein [Lentilactobacillus senioris]